MNNKPTMTAEQAKIYVSKYILPQISKGNQSIIRTLIFTEAENIDWDRMASIILHEHPELTQERIDKDLVAR